METAPAKSALTTPARPRTGDPLIDELNGALARSGEPKEIDRPQEQPTPLAEALEVGATVPAARETPKAKQYDETHSKAVGGHGYRVWVEGEYYAHSAETKGKVVKRYKLPFNLPSLTNVKGESALGIIIGESKPRSLLKEALLKMDPMALRYRTHSIASVDVLQGAPEPTSLQYMSFATLKAHVKKNLPDFPIDPEEYWEVAHLREDIVDFVVNKTGEVDFGAGAVKAGFGVKKTPSDRIKERFAERKDAHELELMNP